MWERIKELGFTACAIAIGCSNLVLFVIIAVTGAAYVYENMKWVLYLEMALDTGFIGWGIERLVKDLRRDR